MSRKVSLLSAIVVYIWKAIRYILPQVYPLLTKKITFLTDEVMSYI